MLRKHLFNSRWKRAAQVLACVAVFCTTYMLILPAITRTAPTFCGHEEHVHADGCYTTSLVCGIEEGEAEMVMVSEGHVHTEACFEEVRELICGQEEGMAVQVAAAGGGNVNEEAEAEDGGETAEAAAEETAEAHVHTEACYEAVMRQVCGQEESEPVYEAVGGHTHTEACYHTELTCQAAEHIHGEQCYSNPSADLETAVIWEQTLPAGEAYTGFWAQDVLTVAASQLGYTESSANFLFEDGRRKGYTRYGAMQGIPYGDWCAMYLQFCLHYAGVDRQLFPSSPSCQMWVNKVSEMNNFFLPGEYVPAVGDIVFFDFNHEGVTHHVGLITELTWGKALDHETAQEVDVVTGFTTIEGNASNTVKYVSYRLDDDTIFGYTRIPENPNPPVPAEEIFAGELAEEEIPLSNGLLDAPTLETADSENVTVDGDSAGENGEAKTAEGDLTGEDDETKTADGETETTDNAAKTADSDTEASQEEKDLQPQTIQLASITESGVRVDFSAPREAFSAEEDLNSLWLLVEELEDHHKDYASYKETADAAFQDDFKEVKNVRLFDICVMNAAGEEVKLQDENLASVQMTFPNKEDLATEEISVIHFLEEGTEVLESEKAAEDVLSFETPSFSVFGVVEVEELTTRFISASGDAYDVTVGYDQAAGIPAGSTLSLTEYSEDSAEYQQIKALREEKLQQERAEGIEALYQQMMADAEALQDDEEFEAPSPEEVRELAEQIYDESHSNPAFSLIDISILDGEGNAVEPQTSVNVQIVMASVPEGYTASDMASTLRVDHFVENEEGLVPEKVADARAAEGSIEVTPTSDSNEEAAVSTITFSTESFSFYTIGWDQQGVSNGNRFTVYYGYEVTVEENGQDKTYFHEFGNKVQRPDNGFNNGSGSNAEYHINSANLSGTDFKNYTYKYAYVRKNGKDKYSLTSGADGKDPVIYGTGSGFKVIRWDGLEIQLANSDEVFVVYESPHKNGLDYNYVDRDNAGNTTRGGTNVNPVPEGSDVDLGEPAHTKTLAENISENTGLPDNTYELTLTATGNSEAKEHHTKADIIFIWDKSGSMRQGQEPYRALGNAGLKLANELEAATGAYPGAITYTLIRYNDTADLVFSQESTQKFREEMNAMMASPGYHYGYATNWEDGLAKAAALNTREDAKQYVIFVTDGKPSLRNTRGREYAENNWDNGAGAHTGNGIYLRNDEWVYVKDNNGNWRWVHGYAGGASGSLYGDTGNHSANPQANLNTSLDLARAIGQSGMEFYAIGAAMSGENMTQQLTALADAAGGTAFVAHNANEVLEAFNPIIEAIKKNYEYQFLEINDTLSATTETVLVDTPGDFKYYRYISELPYLKPAGFSVISEKTGGRVVVDDIMWNNMRVKGNAPGNFPGRDKEYLYYVLLNATDENGEYYFKDRDLYLPYGKTWDDLTLEEKEDYKWEAIEVYQEIPKQRPSYITDSIIASHNWQRWVIDGYDPDNPTVSARTLYHWAWMKFSDADKARYLPYPALTMTEAEKAAYPTISVPVPEASYDPETAKVVWNLDSVEVKKDVTYAVAFTVYPNQDGWDRITALKEHATDADYDWERTGVRKVVNQDGSIDLFEIIYDAGGNATGIGKRPVLSVDAAGNVRIATNDSAELKYRQINTTVDQDGNVNREPGEVKTATYVTPYMSVEPSEFKIRKIWKDTLVPRWPISEVDLEIWLISRGDVSETLTVTDPQTGQTTTKTVFKDSETGDITDKSEIAWIDENNVTWYWASRYDVIHMSQDEDLAGYINIHEPDETLGGTGATRISAADFEAFKRAPETGLHLDSENYLTNGSGQRVTNSKGKAVQYFAYWEVDSYIAPGLVATNIKPDGTPLTGAKGHQYMLREMDTAANASAQFDQHFELDSETVRPMKRDGIVDENQSRLAGTNHRKGELAVTKMALTQDRHEINPDVPFQVTILLTDANGNALMQDEVTGTDPATGQPVITQKPRTDIEYVIYDAEGNVVANPTAVGSSGKGSGYQVGLTYGEISAGAATSPFHENIPYDSQAGAHKLVYSTLYADWTVVIVNLPSNTRWSVQETYNPNTFSNGYVFEGYTLPEGQRGHETLHPQPHFIQDRAHYSGGTVKYDEDGGINETNLVKITDFDDASNILDENNEKVSDANGAAAHPILGYIAADAEELVDIHNIRTADDLEIKKVDADTGEPLAGAKFVIESLRPQTEWIFHTETDSLGKTVSYWAERYIFGENGDSPNMTNVIGPAHYPAIVHIHNDQRYVVRGDVIGMLYSRDNPEDPYSPICLDRDGRPIENVAWVQLPAGTDKSSLTYGVHYITQGGKDYILRRSTRNAGQYEKVPDTTQTHVYYYVESQKNGVLLDTDPNHAAKLKELPIIAGDETVYDIYEVEAPAGYTTILQQLRETNPAAAWDDAAIKLTVTSGRTWDAAREKSVPYVDWYNPLSKTTERVKGQWDDTDKHWDFFLTIGDKRGFYDLELEKVETLTGAALSDVEFSLYRVIHDSTGTPKDTYPKDLTPAGYYNILALNQEFASEVEGQPGYSAETGRTYIWPAGYERMKNTGRIDSEGYLLTADKQERFVDPNGNQVLYVPRYISGDAEFALARNKEGDLLEGLKTDANGKIAFGRLTPGVYWLMEKTPDGYMTAKPTRIVITNNGATYTNSAQNGGLAKEAAVRTNTQTQSGVTTTYTIYGIQVENTPKHLSLPNTGGPGTTRYMRAGSLLLFMGILGLVYIDGNRRRRMKQRQHRRKEER